MAFLDILNGYRVNGDFPIDSRFIAADEAARLGAPAGSYYEGLWVYQEDTNTVYVLTDLANAGNANGWMEFASDNIVSGTTSAAKPNGFRDLEFTLNSGDTINVVDALRDGYDITAGNVTDGVLTLTNSNGAVITVTGNVKGDTGLGIDTISFTHEPGQDRTRVDITDTVGGDFTGPYYIPDGADGTSFDKNLFVINEVSVGNVTTVTISYDGDTLTTYTVQDGTNGTNGTNVTATAITNGVEVFQDGVSIGTIVNGTNGISPTVTQDADGVTITDSTGTSAKVDDGADGDTLSVARNAANDGLIVTSSGGTSAEVSDGSDGTNVTATAITNGVEIRQDGTLTATITNGMDGVSPTVTQDADGVTITDSTGATAKVDDGMDGTPGDTVTVARTTGGVNVASSGGTNAIVLDGADGHEITNVEVPTTGANQGHLVIQTNEPQTFVSVPLIVGDTLGNFDVTGNDLTFTITHGDGTTTDQGPFVVGTEVVRVNTTAISSPNFTDGDGVDFDVTASRVVASVNGSTIADASIPTSKIIDYNDAVYTGGDGITVDPLNVVAVDLAPESGLDVTTNKLRVNVVPNSGLEITPDGLNVKYEAPGNIILYATQLTDPVQMTDEILVSDDSDLGTVKRVTIQNLADSIGTGTGTGGFAIAAVDGTGTDLDITAANTDANPLATEAYADAQDDRRVALSPTANQEIVQPTGTVLNVRGSFDLEDRNGNKSMDFSGISGDFHFEHNGEIYSLFDKDQKKIYYDTTNTSASFPTTGRAGKEIVIKDDLNTLADEITAVEIERNAAGQTLEEWVAAGNVAGDFVNDPANTLTEIALAKDMQLLTNDNYSKMIVATENGNDYHFDLLRFQERGGRLILQTDNLVNRLEAIDTAIMNAGIDGAVLLEPAGEATQEIVSSELEITQKTVDNTSGNSGPELVLNREKQDAGGNLLAASVNDEIGHIEFKGNTSGVTPSNVRYGVIGNKIESPIAGDLESTMYFKVPTTNGSAPGLSQANSQLILGQDTATFNANIIMPDDGTVDGVDVSALAATVAGITGGLPIAGSSLPTADLTDGRVFYLEEHDTTGTNNDTPGWYVYREAKAATGTIGTDYQSAITADWYISGESIEATRLYPTLGDTIGGDTIADVPHAEQFEVTPGIWTFDEVPYLYVGISHDIDYTQDLWDGAPLEPGTTNTLRAGWTLVSDILTATRVFPDTPILGEELFLDVAVSHTDGTNQRPRGFYTYVQPTGDPASRFWEQVTPSAVGQLYNNARENDVIYLQYAEDNFNTIGNNFTAGFYRATGNTAGPDFHTTWTSISGAGTGPFNGFTLAGTPSTTNSVPKWTDATTLTWSPDTGGTGDVTAIEEEIDEIQSHEDVIDHRLEVLESEVSNLQKTYAGDYTFVGNTVVNTLLTANRVDSQGNNPSIVNNILNSEYNPDSNTLRWWIASSSDDTQIAELISEATAVGFSDGIKDPIPFVAINSGENLEGTAKYIDFKLQQEATYEATLLSYADETEVVFETTLHFFNTANTNFNQADTDAGDHHRASALTAEQAADLAEIAAVPDNQILTKDPDGNIIGTTETGIPLFQTTINLVTSPSDLSGKGDLVQWAFRFGGGNNDPVENYSTVDGGVSWSAHVLSSADVATQFGDILAADQHGVGANTTIHPSSNNELYVQGNGTGQVTLLNVRSINGITPRDITKATWDSGQFVGTVTSTDGNDVSLIHKRIITGNNVTEVELYGEVGADALVIYNNQDRAVGNTLLTQNYTG